MQRIKFNDFEDRLARRKAECGYVGREFVPANSGVARTPEKRALLRALNEAIREDGNAPRFAANY